MYELVHKKWTDNHRILTKHGAFKMMWQVWQEYLNPLEVDDCVVLLWMIQSGEYMPNATWCIAKQGLARHPTRATLNDILYLFYDNTQRYYDRPPLAPGSTGSADSGELRYQSPPQDGESKTSSTDEHGDDEPDTYMSLVTAPRGKRWRTLLSPRQSSWRSAPANISNECRTRPIRST